jgi:NhaP-type Na+/H+ or K+/H+ antiporter
VKGLERWLIPSHFTLHWGLSDTIWAILIFLAWAVFAGWCLLFLLRLCWKHDDTYLEGLSEQDRRKALNRPPYWWEKYLRMRP